MAAMVHNEDTRNNAEDIIINSMAIYGGFSQEDSIIINRFHVDNGFFYSINKCGKYAINKCGKYAKLASSELSAASRHS